MKVQFAKELLVEAIKLEEQVLKMITNSCLVESAVEAIQCEEHTHYSLYSTTIKLTNGDVVTVCITKQK